MTRLLKCNHRIILSVCLIAMAEAGPIGVAWAADAPATQPAPALPQIPDRTFKLTDFGAVGDGKTMNTQTFQKAFAAVADAGGGKLIVPDGEYLTLPITLVSHLDLHLEAGATIQFPKDLSAYAQMKPLAPRPESLAKMDRGNASLIYGDQLTDVAITGSGTIDGGGQAWWRSGGRRSTSSPATQADAAAPPGDSDTTQPAEAPAQGQGRGALAQVGAIRGRPKLVILNNCNRLHLDGVTLQNSPMWHFVPVQCTNVTIENVKVKAPQFAGNTDALDPTACTDVLIRNCDLDEGDDNIAIKSLSTACSNVWIENIHCKHGHGISIGSETYGGVHDVTVRNCTFDGGDNGIRIKSARDRGNQLYNFTFSNITMQNVSNPIVIDMTYAGGHARDETKPVTATTPFLKAVRITDVTIKNSRNGGRIVGLPEAPVTDVVLTNVTIDARTGITVRDVKGCIFDNVTIKAQRGEGILQTFSDLTVTF